MASASCTLCPRHCGADRDVGIGFCGVGNTLRVARAAPHLWEEPPISGERGTGAIFFSGCSLRCRFCQNHDISLAAYGAEISVERLREIFRELVEEQGCHSIELVTGTQFIPQIAAALEEKPPVPVIWNSGGYETVESLRRLEGLIDIYLPDLKYMDSALSRTLSGAPDYPEVAQRAICEMVRQTGPAVYDDSGLMRHGTIIRHLILPGCIDNSLQAVEWVAEHFPDGSVPLSLMGQYTPMPDAGLDAPFDRRITEDEYAAVRSWAELCGIRSGFYQELSSAQEEYIPDFSLEGVLPKCF